MKMPRLLDANLAELARLRPSTLAVTKNLQPPSVASMALPPDEPTVAVDDFVELYDGDGATLGIFRVRSIRTAYRGERTIDMEHAIVTLDDYVVNLPEPEEGEEQAPITGSMASVMTALLAYQENKLWALGTVDTPSSKTYTVADSGGSVLASIAEVLTGTDEYYLTYDQSVTPWKINVKALPTVVSCECRVSRNTIGATLTVDRTEMCTRVYSPELPGGYVESPKASKHGVVEKKLVLMSGQSAAEEAEKVLNRDSEPTISADIDAVLLHSVTGEPLDKFDVGDLCRLALPDMNMVLEKKITALHLNDLVSNPKQVRLTISNKRKSATQTAASTIASVKKQSSSASYQASKLNEKIIDMGDSLVIQDKKIDLLAVDVSALGEGLGSAEVRLDGAEATILLHSQTLNAQGNRISQAEVDIDGLEADILLKAEKLVVDDLGVRINQAEADINGAEANIILLSQTTNTQGERLSAAEVDIDGLQADILLRAEKATVDEIDKRLSTAEADINAAEAAILLKASQESVNALGTRLSTAEADINAAEAAISLKAEQKAVDDIGTRLSTAEADINAAEAEIVLKASQESVDGLSGRVATAEEDIKSASLRIDGANSAIELKADKTDIEGMLTVDDSALILGWLSGTDASFSSLAVSGATVLEDLNADDVKCGSLSIGNSSMTIGDNVYSDKGTYVVTSIGTLSQSKRYLTLMTADGGTVSLDIVTDVSISPTRNYINYLGR